MYKSHADTVVERILDGRINAMKHGLKPLKVVITHKVFDQIYEEMQERLNTVYTKEELRKDFHVAGIHGEVTDYDEDGNTFNDYYFVFEKYM